MSRPTTLLKDNVLKWVIRLYNSSQVLVDGDSNPTIAIRKNGSSTGASATVTKRTATTGIYDCEYDPSGEVEGDQFTIEESVAISSTTYENSWSVYVQEPENDIAATDIVSNGAITTLSGAVVNVDTVDTTTTNSDMRGTDNASTFDHTTDEVTTDAASRTASQADVSSLATAASIAALNDISVADILASGDIDGYNIEETLKLCLAVLAGKISGAGTTTIVIRAADDSKNRITATVDSDGNRSSVSLDTTG